MYFLYCMHLLLEVSSILSIEYFNTPKSVMQLFIAYIDRILTYSLYKTVQLMSENN